MALGGNEALCVEDELDFGDSTDHDVLSAVQPVGRF